MVTGKENKFVFLTPMYNMSASLPRLLHSLYGQSYSNWSVVLVDDCSEHLEQVLCNQIINKFSNFNSHHSHIDVTWNSDQRGKRWEMDNVLYGLTKCRDDDIVCRLDADDYLIDLDALMIINEVYNQTQCDALWTMHRWGNSDRNISATLNATGDDVYKHPWVTSHLKTFRKKLVNGVPWINFFNEQNNLVRRTGDQALYLPVLRNASRSVFLPRVVYHYTINERGGEVYQTDDSRFQKQEADFIRSRGYVASGNTWEEMYER